MLYSRNMACVEIFRASPAHEDQVYKRIKSAVFESFSPGRYTDKDVIVKIVNLMYKEYYAILDEFLPMVRPRDFVTFLVSEYERYGLVSDAHKRQEMSEENDDFWQAYALHSRRGIKHVLELLCRTNMAAGKVGRTQDEQEDAIAMVFIAAEELVSLYMRSDSYRGFLDEVTLTLDPNEFTYFYVEEDGKLRFDIRQSVSDFEKYVPSPMFLQDVEAHAEILDASFLETLGLSYKDTLGTLGWVIEHFSDKDNPEALGMFEWKKAIEIFTLNFRITPEQAELLLNGFSLSAQTMEERELFRPKQEYRAYKRAFFRDPADGVEYVFFSRRMAWECLNILIADVPFKKLPPEWQSTNVKKALDVLSLRAGRWFEQVVERNLETLGIAGSSSVKTLSLGSGQTLRIPSNVGEIDFLGFDEAQKMLVIIEAKQVGYATEPRMFRDDQSKFIEGSDSYSAKFIKKYNWVLDNVESVEKHFAYKFNLEIKLELAGYAMITLYPTIVSTKLKEFSCVSISEFMRKAEGSDAWPFSQTPLKKTE
ncbi:TPA: hypothetical protein ACSTLY_002333 [Serratia fonticola]|uniref:hypothetical protein n=1 Tax=Serratia fonticola TaxID=47917 RepID=UPI002179591B|nr:hypothetical protein [Serratia fonticola]CAI0971291.1 Uncharacterised protein [Serratia fonticola]CAI2472472.1 Uncharacterised protein [Serratia fonticola]